MFTRSQVPGRTKGKMAVDILMTAVLLGLMTYSFIGEKAHERLGMAMFFVHFASHSQPFLVFGTWQGEIYPLPGLPDHDHDPDLLNHDRLYGQRDPDLPVSFFWMDTAECL